MLAAGLSQHQRSGREVECSEVSPPVQLRPHWPPVQPPRDHQMQYQPEIALHADCDALADATQALDYAAFYACQGRIHAAQQKGTANSHPLELLPYDASLQRFQV